MGLAEKGMKVLLKYEVWGQGTALRRQEQEEFAKALCTDRSDAYFKDCNANHLHSHGFTGHKTINKVKSLSLWVTFQELGRKKP